MTEGGSPEIPQYLQDSVTSAEAYEQEARREFQIEDYARKRQIPKESMESNATVQRYVTVLRDVDAGFERFRGAQTKKVFGGHPEFLERTNQVAALYQAERMVLEEGFQAVMDGGETLPTMKMRFVTGKNSFDQLLARAAEPYGMTVDFPEAWKKQYYDDFINKEGPLFPEPKPWEGLWAGAPFTAAGEEPWKREGDQFHEWYRPDYPNERHDREHMRALSQEAVRLGMDSDRPAVDPAAHTLLTGIVYGRQLIEETEGLEPLPPAPGLTPPAHERLTRVAPLNRLAVMVLEDAVRPGNLNRERFTTELVAVAKPYGLIVQRSNITR